MMLMASGSFSGWLMAATPAWARKATRKKSKRRPAPAAKPVPSMRGNLPNIQSASALVIDLDSGVDLYGKRPDAERPIASISKLAAVLVAMDRGLDLDDLTVITQVDADVAKGGAKSRLLTGMTVSNLDLLHAGLLGSDNRAVSAMGRAVGLSAAEYAKAMTQKARSLGLKSTRFREPTGLSRENVSTPRETILLLQHALENPVLAAVVGRQDYSAHPVSRPSIPYVSTCRPALRRNAQLLGGKTGYNDFARYCLVISARIDGRRIGMSFLGSEGKLTRFGDYARAADWLVATKPHPKPPKDSEMAAAKSAKGPATLTR